MRRWEFIVGGGEGVEDMRKAGEELSFHQGAVEVSFDQVHGVQVGRGWCWCGVIELEVWLYDQIQYREQRLSSEDYEDEASFVRTVLVSWAQQAIRRRLWLIGYRKSSTAMLYMMNASPLWMTLSQLKVKVRHAPSSYSPCTLILLTRPERTAWTSVPLWKTLERVVARMSNRVFVGLPLCRNDDYLDLCIGFARNVMGAASLTNLVPKILRPWVPWLARSCLKS